MAFHTPLTDLVNIYSQGLEIMIQSFRPELKESSWKMGVSAFIYITVKIIFISLCMELKLQSTYCFATC